LRAFCGPRSWAKGALHAAGVPVRTAIYGSGTFEGADALWINNSLVIVGVGNRTNAEGFRQIKEELMQDGVNCISVPSPCSSTHLLGSLQFIDSETALVRFGLSDSEIIINLLKENKIKMITIPENAEVIEKHLTYDRGKKGEDYEAALDLDNFKKFVRYIREAENSLGKFTFGELSKAEIKYRELSRKRIVAFTKIKKGEKITKEKIILKRATEGFFANEIKCLLGKKAVSDIEIDESIMPEKLK